MKCRWAALVSGICELVVSVGSTGARCFVCGSVRLSSVALTVTMKAGEIGGELTMRLAIIVLVEYALHLTTIVLLWFAVEDGEHAGAAIVGEVVSIFRFARWLFVQTG